MSVNIPEEHLKVINQTDIVLEQFKVFMDGENSSLVIRTEEEYSNAAVVIKAVKDHKKELTVSKDSVVKPVYEEYKEKLSVFTEKEKLIDSKIGALESAGREFRRKVEAEARERQRIADLAAAEERRKAEAAAAAAAEKAKVYEEQGRADKAEEWAGKAAIREDVASSIVAPIVKPEIPKNVRGAFNTRKNYSARIVNSQLLLDHLKVATPPDVLEALQKWSNAQARAAKGAQSTIPGVVFYEA